MLAVSTLTSKSLASECDLACPTNHFRCRMSDVLPTLLKYLAGVCGPYATYENSCFAAMRRVLQNDHIPQMFS